MWLLVNDTRRNRRFNAFGYALKDCLVRTVPNAAPLMHQNWKRFYHGLPELRRLKKPSLQRRSKVELIDLGSPHDLNQLLGYS